MIVGVLWDFCHYFKENRKIHKQFQKAMLLWKGQQIVFLIKEESK